MKNLLIFVVVFLIWTSAFAHDPGMPDSVIINTVYPDLGQPYVDVPIFAVTDEDVCVYSMPITWSVGADGIEPTEVIYYNMLIHWDETYDSVLVDEHFMRMIGWADLYDFYLNTGGYRLRCWSIRFTIDSLAPPQIVTIDTTYDPVNGSLFFGLVGGTEQWIPNFIPGAIYYGITSEIGDFDHVLPHEIIMLRSYPNPFNSSTAIEFTLPKETEIELSIYDLLGRKIEILTSGLKSAGSHKIIFDAGGLSSGVYFCGLRAKNLNEFRRMVILK